MDTLFTKLEEFIGMPVSITISNSISLSGFILEVKSDYLHFKNSNGLTQFIQIKGIKEIVKNSKDNTLLSENFLSNPLNTEDKFRDLLKLFKESWLIVARTNLDQLQGILCDVYEDLAIFIDKEKIIFVPISNIDYVQDWIEENDPKQINKGSKGKSEDRTNDSGEDKNPSSERSEEPSMDPEEVIEAANEKSVDQTNDSVKVIDHQPNKSEIQTNDNEQITVSKNIFKEEIKENRISSRDENRNLLDSILGSIAKKLR